MLKAIDIDELDDVKTMTEKEGLNYIKAVIKEIEEAGLTVGQSHAPMPQWYFDITEEEILKREESILKAIRIASKTNIPATVVHTWIYSSCEGAPEKNMGIKRKVS